VSTFPDVLFHQIADEMLFTPEWPAAVDSPRQAMPAVEPQRRARDRTPSIWFTTRETE
jgi:hypothetical protein